MSLNSSALTAQWQNLVSGLIRDGTLGTPSVIAAFRAMPRHLFVPDTLATEAVSLDAPLPIGYDQTVSQPTTVATMLELLQPRRGEHVLDIGTGSGWQTALLAHCVGPDGQVMTVERIAALSQAAEQALKKVGVSNVELLTGDAAAALPHGRKFDIIVSAASSPEIPELWVQGLKPGGRLLHPVSDMGLRLLQKDASGKIKQTDYPGYVFVPLRPGVVEH